MKFIISGDFHLTNKQPENRSDDYKKTILNKFDFILKTAKEEGCDAIIQPGDFTDSPNLPYSFFVEVLTKIKEYDLPIFTTWGQHDMRYRNKENTFLIALSEACENVHIVTSDSNPIKFMDVVIYGSEFGSDIPSIYDDSAFNVLITHRMVVDKKLWEGQTGFQYSTIFLRKYNFDLIVIGDNHKHFTAERDERYLFNCGSISRSTTAQIEHQPVIYISEISKNKISNVKKIFIPIKPSEEVFKLEKIKQEKLRDEEIIKFIEGIKTHRELGFHFEQNLFDFINDNEVDLDTRKVLETALKAIGR